MRANQWRRAVMDACEEVFREVRGVSLLDVMFGRNGAKENLGDTAWEQPALYTLGCALTALWSSVGIRPSVVLGHSVGEIAAAQAAGVFSLEDGMRFAAARGTLMSQMEYGTMAAIFAPPEQVAVGGRGAERGVRQRGLEHRGGQWRASGSEWACGGHRSDCGAVRVAGDTRKASEHHEGVPQRAGRSNPSAGWRMRFKAWR